MFQNLERKIRHLRRNERNGNLHIFGKIQFYAYHGEVPALSPPKRTRVTVYNIHITFLLCSGRFGGSFCVLSDPIMCSTCSDS